MLSTEDIISIFERFRAENPSPKSELEYYSPFTLLVAVVLSAQATDKSVNIATRELFKAADTPEKILALGKEGLESYIKSIGLYHSKAAHVIGLCEKLISDYNGEVPRSMEDLTSLPGVGRKTANVVKNVVWGDHTMPVDTHLKRISPRIGLAAEGTVEEIERQLLKNIPDAYLEHAHHWLILHGRYVCTARNPKCENCIIASLCEKNI